MKVPSGVSVHVIEKPPCDEREYIGLTAENGMKILLISDPTTEMSAAALSVGAGNLLEDKKYGGVAHLLEHVIHRGSEKYPDRNAYEEFICAHGGSYCAQTKVQCTNYNFGILPNYFSEGFDIFMHMFIKPIFNESAFDSEIDAVNQEYEMDLASDAFRYGGIEKVSFNQDHPLARFSTGNLNTLKKRPKEENISTKSLVVDFYDKWYSSNIMNLAVLSKESLQELADMVLPLINKIPNKNVKIEPAPPDPYENSGRGKIYKVAWITEEYLIMIQWASPNMMKEYRSVPGFLLETLLRSSQEGSLLDYLNQRGWAKVIKFGIDNDVPGCGLINIEIELSSDGFDHWEEVVNMLFQYLNLIRHGLENWRFEEVQKILKLQFDQTEKSYEKTYTSTLAQNMQVAKLEDALTYEILLYDIKPHLEAEIIDALKPGLCCIYLNSHKFKDIANIKEPYYGGMYTIETIPDSLIQRWENCGKSSFLSLPPPNPFIPDKLELLEEPINKASEYPVVIKETQFGRLWYKQDTFYRRPLTRICFLLISPDFRRDVETVVFYQIYEQLVKIKLKKILYQAEQCGYYAYIDVLEKYIKVSIDGFSDKMDMICEKVTDTIFFVDCTETEFNSVNESKIRSYRNNIDKDRDELVNEEISYMMRDTTYLPSEKLQASEAMKYKRFMEMQKDMMKTVIIEALVYGNVDEEKAIEFMDIFLRRLKHFLPNVVPLLESERYFYRNTYIPAGKAYIRKLISQVDPTNLILVRYQIAPCKIPDYVYACLFTRIFQAYVFDKLRTEEHLGYAVDMSSNRQTQEYFVQIYVNSNRDYDFVRSRILAVLRSAMEKLNSMSEETFSEHAKSHLDNVLEKPRTLGEQFYVWTTELTEEQIMFDRENLEAKILRSVTKQDVINFYKRYLAPDAAEKRRITIIARPDYSVEPLESQQSGDVENVQVTNMPEIDAEMEKDEEIHDLKEWVKSMPVMSHDMFIN